MNALRNIRRVRGGYLVRVTRRPHEIVRGPFNYLASAIAERDWIESNYHRGQPGGRLKAHPRTAAVLYAERKGRGLCTRCGDSPARPGRVECAECARVHAMKTKLTLQTKKLP